MMSVSAVIPAGIQRGVMWYLLSSCRESTERDGKAGHGLV